MIKQPLFGQDSSPHKTSSFMGGLITVFIWLVLTLTGVFVKLPSPTPKYKEVQIVLATTPIEEKTQAEESAAAAAAVPEEQTAVTEEQTAVTEPVEVPEIPNPVETPVAQAKVEAPKANPAPAKTQTQTKSTPAPKTTTAPKTTDPSKKVNFDDYQYATDLSQGVDFNNVSNKKQSFDWSQFDEPSEPAPQVSKQVTKVENSSSISGSAASTSTTKNQSQSSSQNSSTTNKTTNNSPTASTNNAISAIKNTQYSVNANGVKAITDAKTSKSSDGQLSMAMTDGSTRILIRPVPPTITISQKAAALLDSNRTVTIKIHVLSSGNVPRNEVSITPESVLPVDVRNEIYDQLSTWLFESSSASAYASFEYTILKN